MVKIDLKFGVDDATALTD